MARAGPHPGAAGAAIGARRMARAGPHRKNRAPPPSAGGGARSVRTPQPAYISSSKYSFSDTPSMYTSYSRRSNTTRPSRPSSRMK